MQLECVILESTVIHSTTPNEENAESELRRVSVTQNSTDSNLLSPESAMSQQDSQSQEDSTISAVTLVREVLYGNRDNVNFVHELYRQAFLLDFNHAGAIRKAIAVYKDWVQMNVSSEDHDKIVCRVCAYSLNLLLHLRALCRKFLRSCWNRWTATRTETWRIIKGRTRMRWRGARPRVIGRQD